MITVIDLLSRLRAATEGSRELSDEVIWVFGWRSEAKGPYIGSRYWYAPDGTWFGTHGQPDPTCNLQDASELVPDVCGWQIDNEGPDCAVLACVSGYSATAATPALALCIAALLARQADSAEPRKGSEG